MVTAVRQRAAQRTHAARAVLPVRGRRRRSARTRTSRRSPRRARPRSRRATGPHRPTGIAARRRRRSDPRSRRAVRPIRRARGARRCGRHPRGRRGRRRPPAPAARRKPRRPGVGGERPHARADLRRGRLGRAGEPRAVGGDARPRCRPTPGLPSTRSIAPEKIHGWRRSSDFSRPGASTTTGAGGGATEPALARPAATARPPRRAARTAASAAVVSRARHRTAGRCRMSRRRPAHPAPACARPSTRRCAR